MTVTRAQRFTRDHPCPICGGWHNLPQGRGVRCWGFLSDDGAYAHCTREEYAGDLDRHRDDTFAHRLTGPCRCGATHDGPPPTPVPTVGRAHTHHHHQHEPPLTVVTAVTRYALPDASTGMLAAVHVREDGREADGTPGKRMWWEDADGRRSLNGYPTAQLGLYGAERLGTARAAALVEGEKKAAALWSLGIPTVATVTGASGTPCDDALRPLVGLTVFLWADHDDAGMRHMERTRERLAALGCTDMRRVHWPDAPPGGDAGDFIAAGAAAADVWQLLALAEPCPEGARVRPAEPQGCEELVLENRHLRDQLQQANEVVAVQRGRLEDLSLDQQVRRNTRIGAARFSAPAFIDEIERARACRQPDDTGRYRIFRDDVVKRAPGLAPDTITDHGKRLAALEGIEFEARRVDDDSGEHHWEWWANFRDPSARAAKERLATLDAAPPAGKKQHGGKRDKLTDPLVEITGPAYEVDGGVYAGERRARVLLSETTPAPSPPPAEPTGRHLDATYVASPTETVPDVILPSGDRGGSVRSTESSGLALPGEPPPPRLVVSAPVQGNRCIDCKAPCGGGVRCSACATAAATTNAERRRLKKRR